MQKPEHHILVCASFRSNGVPQGACHKKCSIQLLSYLENEISDRALPILISSTGCLKACDKGPVIVVYPEGYWYGNITSEEQIDAILNSLERGEASEKFLI